MADQLQFRRGTTAQNLLFTGAQGEIVVDTDKNTVVVHNGVTPGGFPLASSKQLSDSTFYYNEDVGSAADAYILTPKANTSVPSAYLGGIQFGFVTTHPNNGGPATANFQGLGVKSLKFPGGIDPLAGDISGRVDLVYDEVNGWLEIQKKVSSAQSQIRNITASVTANAMTANLLPCTVDFRSATPGNGTVNSRNVSSTISITIPNGATLGTTSGVLNRIAVLAIYGPVNVELAVINITNGPNLDETAIINTAAISAASSSAATVYSNTARAGVPYRIVGFIESTQATAGAWSSVPSFVQGAGGRALASLNAFSGFGFGQTWTSVSRVPATVYTNSTGKPIILSVKGTASITGQFLTATIGGVTFSISSGAGSSSGTIQGYVFVPAGSAYRFDNVGGTFTLTEALELR